MPAIGRQLLQETVSLPWIARAWTAGICWRRRCFSSVCQCTAGSQLPFSPHLSINSRVTLVSVRGQSVLFKQTVNVGTQAYRITECMNKGIFRLRSLLGWLVRLYLYSNCNCMSCSIFSEECGMLEHLRLLFLLYILGMKHIFISCWWGSQLICRWGFNCLWIRKESSIWVSVLTCCFGWDWNVAGGVTLRKSVLPREVWELEACVGFVPLFLWKEEGRTELGDDWAVSNIPLYANLEFLSASVLLSGRGFSNRYTVVLWRQFEITFKG